MDILQTVVSFILVLGLLVFVHELGHFLFAKRAGILVHEFAIGFGPKIFSKRYGETLYSIRILPLGGYVSMAGESPEPLKIKTGSLVYAALNQEGRIKDLFLYEPTQSGQGEWVIGRVVEADLDERLYVVLQQGDQEKRWELDRTAWIHFDRNKEIQVAPPDRKLNAKTPGQRALTIVAGPVFNLILTVILFAIYTFATGVEARLPIYEVEKDSPAAAAGLKKGDVILAVNGKQVNNLDMLRVELMDSKGKPVLITIQRQDQTIDVPVKPKKVEDIYIIGARFNENDMKRPATFLESISQGFKLTYDWSVVILDSFRKLVTGQLSIDSLGGPVQMGDMTGKAAEKGIVALIKWTALLSLNLGIFNLLPIPALDGSRLLFIGLEVVRGRPINPNKEGFVHVIGFAMLMVLMLVVTYNDIVKIFFT